MSALNEPIRLGLLTGTHAYAGNYFASVNGIARGSITVIFDRSGCVLSHTIRDGRLADEMIAKLDAEVARRGLLFPEEVQ